jgi:hypothetical protein
MQRERMKTNLVNTVYGLSEHILHSDLLNLNACSDSAMLTEHTCDLIVSHVNKHVHVCANAPMQQLKHAARFLIDLSNVDENPPRTEAGHNIAQQHLVVHKHVCRGVVNNDAQVRVLHVFFVLHVFCFFSRVHFYFFCWTLRSFFLF